MGGGWPVLAPNSGIRHIMPSSEGSCFTIQSHGRYDGIVAYGHNKRNEYKLALAPNCNTLTLKFVGPIFNVKNAKVDGCKSGDVVLLKRPNLRARRVCGSWNPALQPDMGKISLHRRNGVNFVVKFNTDGQKNGKGFMAEVCSYNCM